MLWENIFLIELKKSYGTSCTSSGQCNDTAGLICPLTTGSCNCPLTSNPIFCDCQRIRNNEFYWNGDTCVAATTVGSSCSNTATSYTCQTLTQGTICNSTNGVFTCQCPYLQYYDSTSNKCLNQLTYNQTCSYSNQCQTVFGLSCLNGICAWVYLF